MRAHPGIMTNSAGSGNSNLSVYRNEKREGFFIIYPVGTINTNTSPILQNEVEQIFELKPEIILFDMKQVNYINSAGLRVILELHAAMKSQGRGVVLMNLQPHIKEVFDIINALPEQRIFANRHELDNYLDTRQHSCSGYEYISKFDSGTAYYSGRAEVNFNQGIEQPGRT